MGRKRYTVESIVRMLREAEVELAGGSTVKQVSRKLGSTTKRIIDGGRSTVVFGWTRARRLKELERENGRLNKSG